MMVVVPVLLNAHHRAVAARLVSGAGFVLIGVGLLAERGNLPAVLTTVVAQAALVAGSGLAYRCLASLYTLRRSLTWDFLSPALGLTVYTVLWYIDDTRGELTFAKHRVFAIALPLAGNAGSWLWRFLRTKGKPTTIGAWYLVIGATTSLLGNIARPIAVSRLPDVDPAMSMVATPAVVAAMATSLLVVVGVMLEAQSRAEAHFQSTNARLHRAANTDALTGIGNRRHIEAAAGPAVATARGQGKPVCILMLDIDHFKAVNDNFGHQAGDQVLREVANICLATLRQNDVLARWGGEEFAILLCGADETVAKRVAERLLGSVRSADVPAIEGKRITISAGIALLGEGELLASAQRRADAALYEAKRNGRDQVRVAQ
jgi:diguanylate cyclase (GGDEF)-like protein